jgi:nitrogen regulatory protein P-II 1
MKMIVAIIRPERLEAVQEALERVLDEGGNYRITIDPVQGHGAQRGEVELFRGRQVRTKLLARTRLSIAVNDQYVEPTIEAIVAGGRTGEIGDGKIFVVPLEDCIRIRTGERGGKAV